MCAIVGSFDKNKLIELIKLNSYRGSHSYSFSTISPDYELTIKEKALGTIDFNSIDIPESHYAIVHIQAPTTEAKTLKSIHPAQEDSSYLWHNGIIKASYVRKMQEYFGDDTNWDTELLLRAINTSKGELNSVDGSFSCLWYDGARAYLFRNSISPMFYDGELSISSTKFPSSIATPPNKILSMDLQTRALYSRGDFKTVENPYYFGDEIE